MTRPKKDEALTKTKDVHLRMNETEYEILLERATATNMTVSDFIRNALNSQNVIIKYEITADVPEIKRLIVELGKIGSNLNQIARYFNQGGMWCGNTEWYRDFSGSGGTAGAGGQIYYKNLDKINAYNGDRITNKDYTTIYYEYNPDGTLTKEIAKVVQKQNGEKFIPAKIFAQAGTIRATYHTNQHMSQEECSKRGITYCGDASGKTVNVKMTNQTTTEKTQ